MPAEGAGSVVPSSSQLDELADQHTSPCPLSSQGSGLSAVDLPGNRDAPGATSAKNHPKNSKKARSAFLLGLTKAT